MSDQRFKISDADVRAARTLYHTNQAGLVQLADEYGVHRNYMYRVVAGKTRLSAGGPLCGHVDGRFKLSDGEVASVRERYLSGETAEALATEYAVHPQYVREIAWGQARANARTPIQVLLHAESPTPQELQHLRERLQMTQAEFAELLGTAESSVWYWESGRRECGGSSAKLVALLQHLPDIFEP